jgi:hypothetical protein
MIFRRVSLTEQEFLGLPVQTGVTSGACGGYYCPSVCSVGLLYPYALLRYPFELGYSVFVFNLNYVPILYET